jgi:hypothetical protein
VNRIPLFACAASAVVILAAQSAPSLAASRIDSGSAPVSVDACRAFTMNAGKAASKADTIEIGFRDLDTVTVNAVDFDVNWGHGDVQKVHDVGTFPPGVTVRHRFVYAARNASSPFFPHPPVTCNVEAVRLSDGSAWHKG